MRAVELFFDPVEPGAAFWRFGSAGGGLSQISVGCGENWPHLVSLLLHEALEFAMSDLGVRYVPDVDAARDHAAYYFVLNHEKFGEASARAARFLADALPDLHRVRGQALKES